MYSDDESHRKTTKFGTKASFLTPKTMKKTTVPWMKTNCIKTIFSILLKLNALKTLQKTQVRHKCLEPVLWNYKRSKKVRRNTCKWIKFVKNVYTSWESFHVFDTSTICSDATMLNNIVQQYCATMLRCTNAQVQECSTILLSFVNNRCSTILLQPVFINIATTSSWFLRVYAGEEKRLFRFRHVFWQFPGNSCDTGFTPKIPAIWQCQDSMLSQKVEFDVIWREL
jgi:hypothetical protein